MKFLRNKSFILKEVNIPFRILTTLHKLLLMLKKGSPIKLRRANIVTEKSKLPLL